MGAKVDVQTIRKLWTPLHKAVVKEHFECAIALIDNNSNVNIQVEHKIFSL